MGNNTENSEYEPLISQSRDMLESMQKEYTEIEKEKASKNIGNTEQDDREKQEELKKEMEVTETKDYEENVNQDNEQEVNDKPEETPAETEVKITRTKRSKKNRRKTNSGNYEENVKIM